MHTPGRHLAAILAARGISQGALARATRLSKQEISAVVSDRRSVTVRIALLVGKALSTSEIDLLDLRRDIDLAKARRSIARRLAKVVPLPITEKAA